MQVPSGLLDEWGLRPDGPPERLATVQGAQEVAGEAGGGLLLQPVRTADALPATLQVRGPGADAAGEHLALRRWAGAGAVRLLRADPGRRTLLVERVGREDLSDHWDEEACEIVARRYADLHVAPMPQLATLASYLAPALDALATDSAVPVPRRLVEQALGLARELLQDPPSAVLHTDLHYATVRAVLRDGEPAWLALAPRPLDGDPHYEPEPMLRHRFEEYGAVGSVRDGIRRRFHTLVDVAGLDEHRARDWVVVRSVLQARAAAGRGERDAVTRAITVAKAVQD